nr:protein TPR1-like isoform X14 [Ipomoea batatas]
MLVSSSADAQLCVWNIVGRTQNRRSVYLQSSDGDEVCSGDTHVMFHTDQLHLLVTHETQLAIYNVCNMRRMRQWIPQGCLSAPISSATYSCNSQLAYASFIDGNIGIFDADNLTLRCRIAPSAYLSQAVLDSEVVGVVYAVVIAAHPQEPNQLAIGLTDGSIKVIEPLESEGEWEISPLEILNDETKLWESTAIVDRDQCRMVSMPECSDAKVARLLYTNSGVSILALSLDGIQKLWKWPNNEHNPIGKHWQPNSGLLMINDVEGVNLEKVVPCMAVLKDDSYIVSACGGKVSLFNIMTFEVMETITSLPSASTFLAFDPHDDNIIAIGTEKSSIHIYDRIEKLCSWNTRLWKKKRSVRIQLPAGEVCSGDTHVMFHVDQLQLLVTHETQLAIYDASKMERINQWIPHGSLSAPISSATYSCDCELIYASFKDGNIGVFDAHKLRLRCRIAPSAYLSQAVNEGVYAVAIASASTRTQPNLHWD